MHVQVTSWFKSRKNGRKIRFTSVRVHVGRGARVNGGGGKESALHEQTISHQRERDFDPTAPELLLLPLLLRRPYLSTEVQTTFW